MRHLLLALLLSCATAPMLARQPAPATTAPALTLRGVVVDAGNGGALPRARIDVLSGRGTVATVTADAEGRFSVRVPAATPLSIRIVKAGYASMAVAIPPRQIGGAEPLRIEVPRGAVIEGRAVDASGGPATRVMIRRLPSVDGTVWSPAVPEGVLWDNLTSLAPDEGGEYRVGGLVAGRYVIEAYSTGSLMTIDRSGNVQTAASAFQAASARVDLQPGAHAAVNLTLERRPAESLPSEPAPDPRGGTIRGTVSSTDGSPLPDATVTAGGPAGGRTARTDAFGRFTLTGISPGAVRVRASKRGYVASEPGQRGGALPGQPLTIEPEKDLDNLSIVLARSGVIGGTVMDEYGEPIQDAGVQLIRVRRQPTGALVATREPFSVQRSDDRGQFRLSGIAPGEYVVMASLPPETADPAAADRTVYKPAYYPDTPDFASASPIRIADGEHVPGVILTMRRVPVARVTGVAHTSQGLPVTGTVRLISRHAATSVGETRIARPGPDGSFAFADIPPGDYVLRTLVESGPSAREFATSSVIVANSDPAPVTIRTSLGSRLTGTIVLEGGATLWGYSAGSASLDPSASRGSVTSVGSAVSSGEAFTLSGLTGQTWVRVWSDDRNWYLKSILIDGLDVTDTPFDFGSDARTYSGAQATFARAASITGRATDDRAAPVRDYAVYVFPTDRDKWYEGSRWVKLARASADGTFTAASLPPGDYWVAALDRVNASSPGFSDGSLASGPTDWVDTELLTMLSSQALRVTVGEGQVQTAMPRLVSR